MTSHIDFTAEIGQTIQFVSKLVKCSNHLNEKEIELSKAEKRSYEEVESEMEMASPEKKMKSETEVEVETEATETVLPNSPNTSYSDEALETIIDLSERLDHQQTENSYLNDELFNAQNEIDEKEASLGMLRLKNFKNEALQDQFFAQIRLANEMIEKLENENLNLKRKCEKYSDELLKTRLEKVSNSPKNCKNRRNRKRNFCKKIK